MRHPGPDPPQNPRLKQIHRFPLPEAPDLRSLGSHFNDLDSAEVEALCARLDEN